MNKTNDTTIIIDTEKLAGEIPSIEFLPPPPRPYDWYGLLSSDELATEAEERESLNTFAAEPANEDNLTPAQEFDILFGYAEERHNGDPCAHPAPEPEPQPYDGYEGQWAGDGSGLDDLADLGEQEGHDF